jgi:signal transduction histidine kinase
VIDQIAAARTPAGFGRGRRAGRIAALNAATSGWRALPPRIHQWSLTEELDSWTRTVVSGLLIGAEATGFDLEWRYGRKEDRPEELARALSEDVDGVILLAPQAEHLSRLLEERDLPVVVAYACFPGQRSPCVVCDNAGGIAQMVRHLARLGHQRIGYLSGPDAVSDIRERRRGFYEGMAAEGLTPDPELVVGNALARMDDQVKPLVLELLRRPSPPTAIICATDALAVTAVESAWEVGLNVPRDLAVTGFDDSDEATQIIPQITTVRQPALEIANQAYYLLACAIEGQMPETLGWQLELPVAPVIRESCGALLSAGAGESVALRDGAETTAIRRELELRMRQLTAMNQEMQELLYVSSHDLRAPLVTIQGFASSLERRYSSRLDKRGRDYLQRIRRSVDSMRELIDALLTLSRTNNEPLNFTRVSVGEVVTRVFHDLQGLAQACHARIRVSRRLPTVLADELALYQIFLNLLGNALKFSSPERPPWIIVGHTATDDEYQFFVQDNGLGIASTHQEEIFQVFRQLGDSRENGSGIGLAIVKRMVLRHGGRVWVESQPGNGATFKFTLPRRETDHVSRRPEFAATAGSRPDY